MKYTSVVFLFTSVCMLLASCGNSQNIPKADVPATGMPKPPRETCDPATQQMLLYLQEGLQEYKIDRTFTVYVSASASAGTWEAYLDDGKNMWVERVEYVYDAAKDWYRIKGWDEATDWEQMPDIYEPVLTGDDSDAIYNADQKRDDIISAAIYKTELSADTSLPWSIRYTGPSGPSVTAWMDLDFDLLVEPEPCLPYFHPMHYLYQDERRDTVIIIAYPKFYRATAYADGFRDDDDAARINQAVYDVDKINQTVHNALFYGYYSDESLIPARENNTFISRDYLITRQDQHFISMRIMEYNDSSWSNHPNEWETGLTVDCVTGEIITLADIIEEKTLISTLLETGAFHCIQVWMDGSLSVEEAEQENLQEILENFRKDEMTVADFDHRHFYLTENGLGLITFDGRYYTCLEADLTDLKKYLAVSTEASKK